MNLLYHFSPGSLSNIYVVAPDDGRDALIVDPAVMDVPLLEAVERLGLYIRSILVTPLMPMKRRLTSGGSGRSCESTTRKSMRQTRRCWSTKPYPSRTQSSFRHPGSRWCRFPSPATGATP